MNEDTFIAKMKFLLLADGITSTQLLTEDHTAQAEERLGFPLPSLLKRIYLEVGNGTFGFFPLDRDSYDLADDFGLVDTYLERKSITQEVIDEEYAADEEKPSVWPENVLTFYDWGDGIYSCLDCTYPDYRVLREDSNESLNMFAVEALSFQQWLQSLFDGSLHFDWETAEKVVY